MPHTFLADKKKRTNSETTHWKSMKESKECDWANSCSTIAIHNGKTHIKRVHKFDLAKRLAFCMKTDNQSYSFNV